jgi:hypothetical protein
MKTLLFALLIAFQGIVYADDNKPEIGRYQLVAAVITTTTPSALIETKRVYKIDTETGQVWTFVSTTTGKDSTGVYQYKEAFLPIQTVQP